MFYMLVFEMAGDWIPVRDHNACPVTDENLEAIKKLRDEKYEGGCRILRCEFEGDSNVDPLCVQPRDHTLLRTWRRSTGLLEAHPSFPVEDWIHQVAQTDTRQGYWSFVESNVTNALGEVDDIDFKDLPKEINEKHCPEALERIKYRLAHPEEEV